MLNIFYQFIYHIYVYLMSYFNIKTKKNYNSNFDKNYNNSKKGISLKL